MGERYSRVLLIAEATDYFSFRHMRIIILVNKLRFDMAT